MALVGVHEVMEMATDLLSGAGIAQPRREARLLMQDIMGWSVTEYVSHERDDIPAIRAEAFLHNVRERAKRIPLSHITGLTYFFGLEFLTDRRALIPRADSEVLVEQALKRIRPGTAPLVVDLGCGSGCLLLSVLANAKAATGVGVDISPEALELSQENAERHGLTDRVSFLEQDFDSADISTADVVISNPPYIATDEIERLEPEVRDHDPTLALDGGVSGLEAYATLVPKARAQMKPGAWFMVEIGHDQGEPVSAMFHRAGFDEIELVRDYGHRDRVVIGRMPTV